MSAHTPGPWEATDSGYVLAGICRHVAMVCVLPDMAERQANRRLIAAAPEILAALSAILDEVDGEDKSYSADSYLPARLIANARAAIDKAMGQNPKPVEQAPPRSERE